MEPTILAIVRYRLPELAQVECGSLVQTYRSLLDCRNVERRFLCVPADRPDVTTHIPAGALLPLSRFMARQPLPEFWALVHKGKLIAGEPCFLHAPRTLKLGPVPHRFESEGECLHFVKLYELSLNVFLVAHVNRHAGVRQRLV